MLQQKFYSKSANNKWWDKYDGEENVLIEDIDTTHSYMGFHLKIWADKYAFPVEVKNSGDLIRPKRIVVTSNYPIRTIFPDPSIHEPLERRFKVIHKTEKWDATVNTALKKSNGKEFKTKKIGSKKRKYDQPLKKPALYRQDANGDIVPNKQKQSTLNKTSLIQKPSMSLSFPYLKNLISIGQLIGQLKDALLNDIEEHYNEIEIDEVNKDVHIENKDINEKDIIELIDSESEGEMGIEKIVTDICTNCGSYILECECFEDSMDDKIDSACFSDDDYMGDESEEGSEDLFDL